MNIRLFALGHLKAGSFCPLSIVVEKGGVNGEYKSICCEEDKMLTSCQVFKDVCSKGLKVKSKQCIVGMGCELYHFLF